MEWNRWTNSVDPNVAGPNSVRLLFGGHVKKNVYTPTQTSQNLYELKIRIRDACESTDMQILSNVWKETD
jgi:hypothetical protein